MYTRRTLYLSNIIRAIMITTRMMLKKTEMTIAPKMASLLSAGSLVSPRAVVTDVGVSTGDKAAMAGPRTGRGHVAVTSAKRNKLIGYWYLNGFDEQTLLSMGLGKQLHGKAKIEY